MKPPNHGCKAIVHDAWFTTDPGWLVFEERFGTWRGLRLIGPDLGPYGYHIDSTMRIEVIR